MATDPPRLLLLQDRPAVCRMDPHAELPDWAPGASIFSLTRTPDELSIVCPEESVPADVTNEDRGRALKLEGPLDFSEVGILASVATPLAEAGVSIFTVSTYDTDYVLLKGERLESAVSACENKGAKLHRPRKDSRRNTC